MGITHYMLWFDWNFHSILSSQSPNSPNIW